MQCSGVSQQLPSPVQSLKHVLGRDSLRGYPEQTGWIRCQVMGILAKVTWVNSLKPAPLPYNHFHFFHLVTSRSLITCISSLLWLTFFRSSSTIFLIHSYISANCLFILPYFLFYRHFLEASGITFALFPSLSFLESPVPTLFKKKLNALATFLFLVWELSQIVTRTVTFPSFRQNQYGGCKICTFTSDQYVRFPNTEVLSVVQRWAV